MLQTMKLLLPALIPSWRFFDVIAPSPRIEFSLLKSEEETPTKWQEFRPRPVLLPVSTMIKRIIWNPHWNESLFLISCAERLIENSAEHSHSEILHHMRSSLGPEPTKSCFRFRVTLISRNKTELQKEIVYTSAAYKLKSTNS